MDNGNLIFPPFQASDYKQEVHAGTYRCRAENELGRIQSRDVHVRAGTDRLDQPGTIRQDVPQQPGGERGGVKIGLFFTMICVRVWDETDLTFIRFYKNLWLVN